MKKVFLSLAIMIGSITMSIAQEYKVITVVESIVPGGVGRSRIIDSKEVVDYKSHPTIKMPLSN